MEFVGAKNRAMISNSLQKQADRIIKETVLKRKSDPNIQTIVSWMINRVKNDQKLDHQQCINAVKNSFGMKYLYKVDGDYYGLLPKIRREFNKQAKEFVYGTIGINIGK